MSAPDLPPAIMLLGPTASGKTGLAVELVQHLPLDIISVDSALVYRDMNIGTAKPDAATLARAPHHLIDLLPPTEAYSAAMFRDDALRLMHAITAQGRVPLLVGGTMLYVQALRRGLNDLPQADPALRAELDQQAREVGWPAMHARLARLDPDTAARLHDTDAQRIQRALEVIQLSGQPMSTLLASRPTHELPFRLLVLALEPGQRSVLHERIAQRFDAMLAQGLVDEVRGLQQRYPTLHAGLPSMRAVGYRQTWDYLAGLDDWATMRDKGVAATRQLAKRQLTWLRGMADVERLGCLDPELGAQVLARVRRHVAR